MTVSHCAVFLAEEGPACLTSHYLEILACVNKSVPEIFRASHQTRRRNRMHFYVFQQQNCRSSTYHYSLININAATFI